MTDFYPMTKWLPTYVQSLEDKHLKTILDVNLSTWVEHLKKLGLKEGRDFKICTHKKTGKKAIFRRGKSPFQNRERYYPNFSNINGR